MRVVVFSLLVACWVLAGAEGANILMTNYSADQTEVRPLRMEGGGMLGEGGAVAAVGSFIGTSDDEIRALARSAEGIEELSRRFVMHGEAMETGTGGVLEETGIYGNDASAQILPGHPLAGETIYTVVSTAGGLLVWKSDVVFPVDAPISAADVTMTDIPVDVLGSQLLVGETGGVVEVGYFGGAMVTVELAAVDGLFEIPEERVVRFEREPETEEPVVTVAVEDEEEEIEPPVEPVDPDEGDGPEPGAIDPPLILDDLEIVVVDLIDFAGVGHEVVLPPNWLDGIDLRWISFSSVVADAAPASLASLDAFVFSAGDAGLVRSTLPEPGVAAFLGFGVLLLMLRRRRC